MRVLRVFLPNVSRCWLHSHVWIQNYAMFNCLVRPSGLGSASAAKRIMEMNVIERLYIGVLKSVQGQVLDKELAGSLCMAVGLERKACTLTKPVLSVVLLIQSEPCVCRCPVETCLVHVPLWFQNSHELLVFSN